MKPEGLSSLLDCQPVLFPPWARSDIVEMAVPQNLLTRRCCFDSGGDVLPLLLNQSRKSGRRFRSALVWIRP